MNFHRHLWIVLAALALVASGCEKGSDEEKKNDETSESDESDETGGDEGTTDETEDDSDSDTPSDDTADTDDTASAGASMVKLLSPGAEPRQKLRYKFEEGQKDGMQMVMTMSMTGGPMGAMKLPATQMDMTTKIISVESADKARYEFEIVDAKAVSRPGVDDMMVTMMQQGLSEVKGMGGSADVDSRGFNSNLEMKLPPNAPPQMQQMMGQTTQGMEQMSSPLPEEEVGVGAKWKVTQTIEQQGMKIDQVTEFELVELDGDKGKLEAKVTQNAGNQKIKQPGSPVEVELVKLESTGEGVINFDLNHLVPNSSIATKTDMSMQAMGQKMDMGMELSVEIKRQ